VDADLEAVATAEGWSQRSDELDLPESKLTLDREDPRPLSYGIETARQFFTERQQVVLGSAMRWIGQADLRLNVRRALTLSVSNALATNNRLCSYAVDYGRLSALFSVRGYALPASPVELNPLHVDGGRGTLANCLQRVARSAATSVRRYSWSTADSKTKAIVLEVDTTGVRKDIRPGSALCEVEESVGDVDLCLFDPPYFDYIPYGELSEFYRSWLATPHLAGVPLVARAGTTSGEYGAQLGACFRAMLARLRTGRPFAFTYHSANPAAWGAVAVALDSARLRVTAVWPVRSDGHMGHHSHPGNCEWDLVIVCRRREETWTATLSTTVADLVNASEPLLVSGIDRVNLGLALEVVAARYGTVRPDWAVGGSCDG
jgi:adenine-specific DNA methylase